jgi:PDZ domain-containing protein
MDGLTSPPINDAALVEEDDLAGVPESLRPPQRVPKWPFVLAGVLLAFALAIVIAWPIDMPYYAWSPGPVADTSDVVSVPDGEAATGDLLFLTVELREVNLLEFIAANLDPQVSLSSIEAVRPSGVSPEQLRRRNLEAMNASQQRAIYVALTKAGYEVDLDGQGALITGLVEDSPAAGILEPLDLITAIDGEPVEFAEEAIAALSGRAPGEIVRITVQRPLDDSMTDLETLDVEVTLAVWMGQDADGNEIVDPERGMIGVFLDDVDAVPVFPIDVEIDAENIGGPSAGMMFTLEIINQLTPEDLTHGNRIAGTGTIALDGTVGAIGGMRQKVFGAIAAGAEYVLAPDRNYDEAVDAAGDDIEVIRIETIDDALEFLRSLS